MYLTQRKDGVLNSYYNKGVIQTKKNFVRNLVEKICYWIHAHKKGAFLETKECKDVYNFGVTKNS